MGIAFGVRTAWVADVLADLKGLVQSAGFAPDLVYEYINDPGLELEEPTGDKFASIYPGTITTGGPVTDGSPATWAKNDGNFSIDIAARITKDARGRSVAAISEQARGFSDLTKKVCKAVHRENLANSSNQSYLFEPIRVLSVTFPRRNNVTGWARATVTLSVKFRMDFS